MVCLLAGTRFTKSLVLFGGWQAACRLDCYKINTSYLYCRAWLVGVHVKADVLSLQTSGERERELRLKGFTCPSS
jgi:hypothetical protein